MNQHTLIIALLLCSRVALSQHVAYEEWQNLTTSGKLPAKCVLQKSNNNLDLVKFKGRYYLAFRTAPTHFASTKTVLYVVSSSDLEQWTFETEVKLGRDIREPRFAVFHDTLNLYFFTGGKRMLRFEPQQLLLSRTAGNQTWTPATSMHLDGYVPWRVRVHNDTMYLSAYYGRQLYKKNPASDLRLFTSSNATAWTPISVAPQIAVANAEEGEFVFDQQGNLYATVRLEGTGTLVCKADKCCLSQWQTKRTKYKYDSALLFTHNDDVYLISRRNLDGPIDKRKHRTNEKQGKMSNLIRYSITRKVTALFKLNKDSLTLAPITDFPSTGDCSYAAMSRMDQDTYLLMNYSSDIHGPKKSWIRGQLGRTYIYLTTLRLE